MPLKNPKLDSLETKITQCARCPRLITWTRQIAKEKTKRFQNENYWGKPVPGFGDPQAQILIVGLAPAAHGANRTGRMFTGDRSGDWLFRALFENGLANQPKANSTSDGLTLKNVYITAICHCAPPLNKPLREEIGNCTTYLTQTFEALHYPPVTIALGGMAFSETLKVLSVKWGKNWHKKPKFSHGSLHKWEKVEQKSLKIKSGVAPKQQDRVLLGSYHPSQQNTFTGRLTHPMLNEIFKLAKKQLA